MATANKPEVVITLLIFHLGMKFQKLSIYFPGRSTRWNSNRQGIHDSDTRNQYLIRNFFMQFFENWEFFCATTTVPPLPCHHHCCATTTVILMGSFENFDRVPHPNFCPWVP